MRRGGTPAAEVVLFVVTDRPGPGRHPPGGTTALRGSYRGRCGMTLYVDELLVPASVERLAGLGYSPVSVALERLRQGVCEGEALVSLLRALWDLVLNDPELDRRL